MKYAIIEISGKQFWVEIGKFYDINKIKNCDGKLVSLNRVLLIKDKNNICIGQPYLKNVEIIGQVLEQFKSKKKIIYKMQSKKKTRRKQGYRQNLTRLLINNIKEKF